MQPDRQGISEIRYVTGYLAYWDELRRRHPNMLLDSCASGGRRNDIDTLRRAVPLTRSDYLLEPVEPISQQMQTSGHGPMDPIFWHWYERSGSLCFPKSDDTRCHHFMGSPQKRQRHRCHAEADPPMAHCAPNYYGDFYPLTSYSLANDVWGAMQFDRPEVGEGFIEVFRRSRSPYETARFKLQGLDAAARYTVTNLDISGTREFSGQELMTQGLEVRPKHAPESAIVVYRRLGMDVTGKLHN